MIKLGLFSDYIFGANGVFVHINELINIKLRLFILLGKHIWSLALSDFINWVSFRDKLVSTCAPQLELWVAPDCPGWLIYT